MQLTVPTMPFRVNRSGIVYQINTTIRASISKKNIYLCGFIVESVIISPHYYLKQDHSFPRGGFEGLVWFLKDKV